LPEASRPAASRLVRVLVAPPGDDLAAIAGRAGIRAERRAVGPGLGDGGLVPAARTHQPFALEQVSAQVHVSIGGVVGELNLVELGERDEGEERSLHRDDAISGDAKLRSTIAAYDRIKQAQAELVKIAPRYDYLEQERRSTVGYRGPRALYGSLFKYARLLMRAIDERAKPNGERIPMFRDSAKESLELDLFSTSPVYDDYEILRLTDSLTEMQEVLGANDANVKAALKSKTPADAAKDLIAGTKLDDVAFVHYVVVARQLTGIRDPGKLTHHQTFDVRPRRFVVLDVGPVIADLRVG